MRAGQNLDALAFTRYADANGGGLTAAKLLTRIVVNPDGPEAVAFRASDAAQTLAGPIGD